MFWIPYCEEKLPFPWECLQIYFIHSVCHFISGGSVLEIGERERTRVISCRVRFSSFSYPLGYAVTPFCNLRPCPWKQDLLLEKGRVKCMYGPQLSNAKKEKKIGRKCPMTKGKEVMTPSAKPDGC